MLVPGFMAGDASLTRMALWLRTGGYELARNGIAWNTGRLEPTVTSLEHRLERAVDRTAWRALLIGQGREGVMGRVLAVRPPALDRRDRDAAHRLTADGVDHRDRRRSQHERRHANPHRRIAELG